MAARTTKKTKDEEVTLVGVPEPELAFFTVTILGTAPMVMHSFNEKAKKEMLLPAGPRRDAASRSSLKHDPLAEYQASLIEYDNDGEGLPTLLAFPATAITDAMKECVKYIPGVDGTDVDRCIKVGAPQMKIPIWGVPKMGIHMVRMSGVSRAPDMRTRAFIEEWASTFEIWFFTRRFNLRSVTSLLEHAGRLIGLGDWRLGKGGPYGGYTAVLVDDEDQAAKVQELKRTGDRDAQLYARDNPDFLDADSRELFTWFEREIDSRGRRSELARNGSGALTAA